MRSRLRFRPRLAEPNPKSGRRRRLGFETDFTSQERDRDESEMKFWRRIMVLLARSARKQPSFVVHIDAELPIWFREST
ncbi:hypothetical protein F2Q70_00030836 [Brassica cretica]|uniref:Uncharacterized protein n=1 Tax=Brassica cretica TaxID=69181 RepID=A0A8S9FGF7_BRACR|nr:hypothetical protein F2Q70_00030836 [Brassica cretica]